MHKDFGLARAEVELETVGAEGALDDGAQARGPRHDVMRRGGLEEDSIIQQILTTNDAVENEYNFYMKLYSGDRHVDQFYQLIRRKKKMKSETDPVERLLSIKAYANPHYIATEFMENCEHKAVDEVIVIV